MWAVVLIATAGAGTAQAESLNPQSARAAVVKQLALEYGSDFTEATSVWVVCPKEVLLVIDGEHAFCDAEFGRQRTRHYVSATVTRDFTTEITDARQWRREWRRCGKGRIRGFGKRGILTTNDRRCATDVLMISDLDYLIRMGRLKRKTVVAWHGTNMIGMGGVARHVCLTKRRGSLYRISCFNSLGDGFKLRLRY